MPQLSFFPGFRISSEVKLRLVARCVDLLRRDFTVVPIASYVDRLTTLRAVQPPVLPAGRHCRHATTFPIRSGEDS